MTKFPQMLSPKEVAEILGVQVRLVREMLSDGRLPGVQVGKRSYRIPRDELLKWIRSGKDD